MRLSKLAKTAVAALEDIKARDIVVLDVRKLTSLYDTMIVATAESARQTKALANHVRERMKAAGARVFGVEGELAGEWVLVDFGDLVVHIMQPAIRQYYNLEELWAHAPKRGALATARASEPLEASAGSATRPRASGARTAADAAREAAAGSAATRQPGARKTRRAAAPDKEGPVVARSRSAAGASTKRARPALAPSAVRAAPKAATTRRVRGAEAPPGDDVAPSTTRRRRIAPPSGTAR